MTNIVILVLIGLLVALWRQVNALRDRVAVLEFGATPDAIAEPVPVVPPAVRDLSLRKPATIVTTPRSAPERSVAEADLRGEPMLRTIPPSPPPATPAAAPAPAPAARNFGFEDIFGRRLPIWAGGVTLAVAGFLIVKYSIDAGLLSPRVRVVLGLVFGSALIAGAEAALRGDRFVRDARVRQALAGAGIATLYASVLVAANLYDLIAPLSAFVCMAAITLLAGGLSIRFGSPSAVLGLIGGLAAPALVGSGPPDIPLLAAYLALAVGGLCALSRSQRWMWLGVAALVGGFGWGALLILNGALDTAAALSLGGYVMLIAIGLPVLLFTDRRGWIVRAAAGLAGCAQMAAIVATGGFAPLEWSLFGLLSAALIWLSRRETALADMPVAGLAIALALMLAWPDPAPAMLAIVLGGAVLLYGGAAMMRIWRADGRIGDAGQIAALALAILALPLLHVRTAEDVAFAGLALIGTLVASGAAVSGWRNAQRRWDARFATLATTAALLLSAAGHFALPGWLVVPWIGLVATALLLLAARAEDGRIEKSAWTIAAASVVLLIGIGAVQGDLDRAAGIASPLTRSTAAIEWGASALVAIMFAWRGQIDLARCAAQIVATLLGYGAIAQIVPPAILPIVPALLIAGLGLARRAMPLPALATACVLASGWAAGPVLQWLSGGAAALIGEPLFVGVLPSIDRALLRIAAPAIALVLIMLAAAKPWPPRWRTAARIIAALAIGIALHIGYKQLFAIDTMAAFVAWGMAERTLFALLIAAGALLAWYRHVRLLAGGFMAISLAHFLWFTALLHNPLWAAQAVGGWPIVNLLLPAYATALAIIVGARRFALPPLAERARGWLQIALVLLFALSSLRQIAHGTIPSAGAVTPAEDIARSILAIALAIGFLWWGIKWRAGDWRIASLVLMLGAVAKVFLFDASGLDGLLRIASFAALGFSLIGIGWIYSRYLPGARLAREGAGG